MYPSIPSVLVVTTEVITLTADRLQELTIRVTRDEEEFVDLTIYKAQRFITDRSTLAPGVPDIVPKSGGLERVITVSIPEIQPEQGFAVAVPQLFSSVRATDILARWELSGGGQGRAENAGYIPR